MYPTGVIYQNGDATFGVISPHAPIHKKILFALLRAIGGTMIALPVIFVFYTMAPAAREEVVYAARSISGDTARQIMAPAISSKASDEISKTLAVHNQARELGVNPYFSIAIPKIAAYAAILPNIDPSNEKQYLEALKEGVAHAKGTHFPGEGKTIFLFSHSTNSPWFAARYGAVFYLLGKLEKDDRIIVFFADKKYEYSVTETKVVMPTDTSWLKEGDEEQLILQTCTPPGTTFKRLLVIAKPVDNTIASTVE